MVHPMGHVTPHYLHHRMCEGLVVRMACILLCWQLVLSEGPQRVWQQLSNVSFRLFVLTTVVCRFVSLFSATWCASR